MLVPVMYTSDPLCKISPNIVTMLSVWVHSVTLYLTPLSMYRLTACAPIGNVNVLTALLAINRSM
jgi:hypothetical protein